MRRRTEYHGSRTRVAFLDRALRTTYLSFFSQLHLPFILRYNATATTHTLHTIADHITAPFLHLVFLTNTSMLNSCKERIEAADYRPNDTMTVDGGIPQHVCRIFAGRLL